jgi:hypothetical protein
MSDRIALTVEQSASAQPTLDPGSDDRKSLIADTRRIFAGARISLPGGIE